MATQRAIAIRVESAINRLTDALGRDVAVRHKDADVQTVMQLEALAEAVEAQRAAHAQALAEAEKQFSPDAFSAMVGGMSVEELAELPGVGEATAKRMKAEAEKQK